MNREIKFRGRCVITGRWAYGYYYISKGNSMIRLQGKNQDKEVIVTPESVGQFTGFKAEKGKEVFDDDVLSCKGKSYKLVRHIGGCYELHPLFVGAMSDVYFLFQVHDMMKIKGNTHDNPELIK